MECGQNKRSLYGGGKWRTKHLTNKGLCIGNEFRSATNIRTAEPYLIKIGNNVTLSHDVDFITHDKSVCKIFGVDHDLYGKITIGNNCFIGAHAVLMYGMSLANNVIVATSSLVTKSVTEENVIVAGNPARIIGTWDKFKSKSEENVIHAGYLSEIEKKEHVLSNIHKLVKR